MAYSTPSSQKHTARSFLKREPAGNSADYAATVYEKGKCKVSERKSESLLCYVMCYSSHKKRLCHVCYAVRNMFSCNINSQT